jgi:hypothetical protein
VHAQDVIRGIPRHCISPKFELTERYFNVDHSPAESRAFSNGLVAAVSVAADSSLLIERFGPCDAPEDVDARLAAGTAALPQDALLALLVYARHDRCTQWLSDEHFEQLVEQALKRERGLETVLRDAELVWSKKPSIDDDGDDDEEEDRKYTSTSPATLGLWTRRSR